MVHGTRLEARGRFGARSDYARRKGARVRRVCPIGPDGRLEGIIIEVLKREGEYVVFLCHGLLENIT